MITFIAHVRVKPEAAADFEALMADVTAKTLANEPGVAWYACSKSVEDPELYVIVEVYQDTAVHAAHMASPWVVESLPKASGLMVGLPQIKQYVSDGSEPVRTPSVFRP